MLTYLLIALGVILAALVITATVIVVRPQLLTAALMRIPWLRKKALETVAENPDLLSRVLDAKPDTLGSATGMDHAAIRQLQSQLTSMTPEQRQATLAAAQSGDTSTLQDQLAEVPPAAATVQRNRQQAKKKAKARAARKRARTQRR